MMEIRRATREDIPQMITLRKWQLHDEGLPKVVTEYTYAHLDGEMQAFFERTLAEGSLAQWFAVEDGEVIGASAVCYYQVPPSYANLTGQVAYITNMYTDPAFRGKGIATALLGCAVEDAKARGCRFVRLLASDQGRPVYAKFGFQDSEESMVLRL